MSPDSYVFCPVTRTWHKTSASSSAPPLPGGDSGNAPPGWKPSQAIDIPAKRHRMKK
nr:hypothetical protein TetV2_00007 [Oceanusvirus sp.]